MLSATLAVTAGALPPAPDSALVVVDGTAGVAEVAVESGVVVPSGDASWPPASGVPCTTVTTTWGDVLAVLSTP